MGTGIFLTMRSRITSPANGLPGNSERLTKPSPSMCTSSMRRPLSVVTSGTGMSGRRSASLKNTKGSITQRDSSCVARVTKPKGAITYPPQGVMAAATCFALPLFKVSRGRPSLRINGVNSLACGRGWRSKPIMLACWVMVTGPLSSPLLVWSSPSLLLNEGDNMGPTSLIKAIGTFSSMRRLIQALTF